NAPWTKLEVGNRGDSLRRNPDWSAGSTLTGSKATTTSDLAASMGGWRAIRSIRSRRLGLVRRLRVVPEQPAQPSGPRTGLQVLVACHWLGRCSACPPVARANYPMWERSI